MLEEFQQLNIYIYIYIYIISVLGTGMYIMESHHSMYYALLPNRNLEIYKFHYSISTYL